MGDSVKDSKSSADTEDYDDELIEPDISKVPETVEFATYESGVRDIRKNFLDVIPKGIDRDAELDRREYANEYYRAERIDKVKDVLKKQYNTDLKLGYVALIGDSDLEYEHSMYYASIDGIVLEVLISKENIIRAGLERYDGDSKITNEQFAEIFKNVFPILYPADYSKHIKYLEVGYEKSKDEIKKESKNGIPILKLDDHYQIQYSGEMDVNIYNHDMRYGNGAVKSELGIEVPSTGIKTDFNFQDITKMLKHIPRISNIQKVDDLYEFNDGEGFFKILFDYDVNVDDVKKSNFTINFIGEHCSLIDGYHNKEDKGMKYSITVEEIDIDKLATSDMTDTDFKKWGRYITKKT